MSSSCGLFDIRCLKTRSSNNKRAHTRDTYTSTSGDQNVLLSSQRRSIYILILCITSLKGEASANNESHLFSSPHLKLRGLCSHWKKDQGHEEEQVQLSTNHEAQLQKRHNKKAYHPDIRPRVLILHFPAADPTSGDGDVEGPAFF
ncbi:uncharacterized protein LOC127796695 [Diospyros lotus]|uniref:uncharacterized protein LOC127796695 n=1 Tax=Diospyros lotus TaxID=55363 RepID=UPI0022556A77|nr:uncharacterized protein LOC127796695 [Diospyros lotus]